MIYYIAFRDEDTMDDIVIDSDRPINVGDLIYTQYQLVKVDEVEHCVILRETTRGVNNRTTLYVEIL